MPDQSFKLLAIVTVDRDHSVLCQQPHCGHRVYARIHVVEEAGQLMVMGSDCFARRYGVSHTVNFHGHGSGGGRVLTEAELELLLNNTQELLAQFEAERQRELALAQEKRQREEEQAEAARQKERALAEAKLANLRQMFAARQAWMSPSHHQVPAPHQPPEIEPEQPPIDEEVPLPSWANLKKPNSSFFAYGMGNGQCWVLIQSASHAGCFIAPAPTPFEGWDEALPPSLGMVDAEREVYMSDSSINALVPWFSSRQSTGSRIDSDAAAILRFALGLQIPTGS
ncbi:hypothetical protein HUU62_02300 [Rhodoferax sp. 4810]|nr:hypothetical protein [Rhodoferax jenense]